MVLYIVATPIGNLGDISARAIEVLATVDLIAAEDTRRCRQLLHHIGVECRVVACHEHNEERQLRPLIEELVRGQKLALVSDAGTPLVSDPGFRLVRAAIEAGVRVVPIPGACAAIAALSVAGLAPDRFVFEGFLPARSQARQTRLAQLGRDARTLILYESPRRIVDLLQDVVLVLGKDRRVVIARELSKTHETVLRGEAQELLERVQADPEQQLGEIVVLLEGSRDSAQQGELDTERLLRSLLSRMPLKEAVACAAEISERPRNELYRAALVLNAE